MRHGFRGNKASIYTDTSTTRFYVAIMIMMYESLQLESSAQQIKHAGWTLWQGIFHHLYELNSHMLYTLLCSSCRNSNISNDLTFHGLCTQCTSTFSGFSLTNLPSRLTSRSISLGYSACTKNCTHKHKTVCSEMPGISVDRPSSLGKRK